jgi:hypothetical protein
MDGISQKQKTSARGTWPCSCNWNFQGVCHFANMLFRDRSVSIVIGAGNLPRFCNQPFRKPAYSPILHRYWHISYPVAPRINLSTWQNVHMFFETYDTAITLGRPRDRSSFEVHYQLDLPTVRFIPSTYFGRVATLSRATPLFRFSILSG